MAGLSGKTARKVARPPRAVAIAAAAAAAIAAIAAAAAAATAKEPCLYQESPAAGQISPARMSKRSNHDPMTHQDRDPDDRERRASLRLQKIVFSVLALVELISSRSGGLAQFLLVAMVLGHGHRSHLQGVPS